MVVYLLEQVIALSVLIAASLYDLKYREVPDWIWILGIGGGAILRALDPGATVSYVEGSWPLLVLTLILVVAEWITSASGEADVLAYLTLLVLATTPPGPLPPPFAVYLLSKVLLLLVIPVQFLANLIRVKREPELIADFDEPLWRKVLALLLLSPHSKHLSVGARIAEERAGGRRRFVLRAALSPIDRGADGSGSGEGEERGGEGTWIAPTYPMIPFIAVAYLIVQLLGL